jgi:bacillithiol biosynthesis cysteine-adding enzyme BshC
MEIREHRISFHLPLARAYVEDFPSVSNLYDYDPNHPDSYIERLHHLRNTSGRCNRDRLVNALMQYNKRIGNHLNSIKLIEKLNYHDAVVVVGGQQPGILTGPLYSVYKVMTLLQLAKREEQRLGVPVIPVFWIAGEDHDWDEVNHIHVPDGEWSIRKQRITNLVTGKRSISHIEIRREEWTDFVSRFMASHPSSEYAETIERELMELLEEGSSLSELFARTFVSWFGEHGLVLVDSAAPELRSLEGELFAQIIERNDQITRLLVSAMEQVQQMGYPPQVDANKEHANLFFYFDGERLPIDKQEHRFYLRNGMLSWSREDLLELASTHPHLFSCNVVTRPLMQEFLFPVLAFVGGPGEISYWGLYREIFHLFGYKMPIIIPRLSITLIERHVQKLTDRYGLTFLELINKLDEKKNEWLKSQEDYDYSEKFQLIRAEITKLYRPVMEILPKIEKGLLHLSEQNLKRILDQVTYLEKKTSRSLENRYRATLSRFERAKASVIPDGKPQERIYTPYTFIIRYGMDWWKSFISLPLEVNNTHKEIIL